MALNKKSSMELSMNFIVTLIITIVVFSMLLYMGYNFLGKGESKLTDALNNYEQQKFELSCDNPKVCIETTKKTTGIAVYNMKINNVGANQNFQINVTGFPIIATYTTNAFNIPSQQTAHKVILIDASTLIKGTYSATVTIKNETSTYFSQMIYLYVE